MAQESCNLDKDEAEILKTSSSSPPPPQATSPPPPSPLLTRPSQEFPPQGLEPPVLQSSDAPVEGLLLPDPSAEDNRPAVQCVNRCFSCRKKVGLTAFRCRCGHLFCPRHRYSDTHDCSFDYKAAGRAEISKNNPLIRAAKIIKI